MYRINKQCGYLRRLLRNGPEPRQAQARSDPSGRRRPGRSRRKVVAGGSTFHHVVLLDDVPQPRIGGDDLKTRAGGVTLAFAAAAVGSRAGFGGTAFGLGVVRFEIDVQT